MPGQAVNIGGIYADLEVNSGNVVRGLAEGRRALDAFDAELKQLDLDLIRGTITQQTYNDRITELVQTTASLAAKMQTAGSAIGVTQNALDIYNASAKTSLASTGALGRGLMQLGYVADDIQYGFQAIVNNVAPAVQSLSQAMGASAIQANVWAASIQIAAVGAYQLYAHWDQLEESLLGSKVRDEAEEMEYLAQKTHKTADETERLNKLKKEQNEIHQMMAGRTDAEQEQAKDVGNAIRNGDPDAIARGLTQTLQTQGRGSKITEEEFAAIRDKLASERIIGPMAFQRLNRGDAAEVMQAAEVKARELEDKKTTDRVQTLMNDAKSDPGKLKELMAIVRSNPGAFPAGFADTLGESSAETKAAKKAKDKGDKLTDDLNKQGHENQAIGEAKAEAARNAQEKLNDQLNLQGDENKRIGDKKEQDDASRLRKEASDKAESAVPGIDRMTQSMVMKAMMGEGTESDIALSLGRMFRGAKDAAGNRLLSDDEAGFAAADKIAEAKQKVGEQITKAVYDREGRESSPSNSEIYGVSSLTDRIQGAISNRPDNSGKILSNMDRMLDALFTIAGKPSLNPGAR